MEDSQWEDETADVPAWVEWATIALSCAGGVAVVGIIWFALVVLP